eukprot:CAMPEP_0115374312 /NCGR_PEP_ID=MMETSP0271-20121206/1891_1 /TAXON_ID=71861 /ORGANISM="Scrippsiella trochoidea, Strain CCMP3099" /LENGTH=1030 /DNA_ID=CAMNT_0002797359 /DNA_START=21 /DNA_END=3113 /DNA_ORIENTATION=+
MADAIDADVAEALKQLKRGFKETQPSQPAPRFGTPMGPALPPGQVGPTMPPVQRPTGAWEANKMPRMMAPSGMPPKAQTSIRPVPPRGQSAGGPGLNFAGRPPSAGLGQMGLGGRPALPTGPPAKPLAMGGVRPGPTPMFAGTNTLPAPGAGAPAGVSAAATASATAAGVAGGAQAQVEIPQSYVGLVLGKQASTINAIKNFSKANLVVEQHTPAEDRAQVMILGQQAEVDKAKHVIESLVDGSMNTQMLFQMLGTQAPAGAAKLGGLPGLSIPTQQVGAVMPTASALPISTSGGGVPQDPTQLHDSLNEYYARWWSQYGNMVQQGQDGASASTGDTSAAAETNKENASSQAFDKTALARLAEQAAQNEELEKQREAVAQSQADGATSPSSIFAPLGSSSTAPGGVDHALPAEVAPSAAGFAQLGQQPVDNQFERLPLNLPGDLPPLPSLPASISTPMPELPAQMPPAPMPLPQQQLPPPQQPPPTQQQPPLQQQQPTAPPIVQASQAAHRPAFAGFSLNPAAAPQAQKDNDSVQNMLQRLQSNAQQTKQAMSVQQPQQPFGQVPRPTEVAAQPAGAATLDSRLHPPEWDATIEHRVMHAQTPAEIADLGKTLLTKFPTLQPEQLADLLGKMERMVNMFHGEFLSEISRLLAARLKDCTSMQLATLMSTFLVWKPDTRERFSEYAVDLAIAAFSDLPSRLMEMAPHELNCCLAGIMCLGFADKKFFVVLGRSVVARHKTFGLVQLSALLTILSEMRLVHVDLFTSAAQVICPRVRELRPVDIMRVLRSFAKCNVQHETLCHAFSVDIIGRFKDKGPNAGFTVEDLCEIAWIMCILQSYSEEFFRLVLNQLEGAPKVTTDSLCMLYECHLALDSEFKDPYSGFRISPEQVQPLLDIYRQSRKDARRCSERVRSDVTSVLKSLVEGTVKANHGTSIGLLTDVVALRKRSSTDGYIHIDIDSPLTSVRPLDQEDIAAATPTLDGSVAFKRRLMQKHNLRLIVVQESEWRRLEDSKDKRRHLRSLLATLGDVLE